jgi:tripartite-type tricarboxylate transporter receptor subunit TctC
MPRTPIDEIDELFDELDQLLKNPDVNAALAARGVNTSLAMVAADGLRAYLKGDKARAAEDLSTAAEEIASRHARGAGGRPS